MASWGEFAADHPALAAFGAERLTRVPAYLATIRADATPRVHPVTPIISARHLFLFMEPTSPKGRDLRERGWYALHSAVPDNSGTGGEFQVRGIATPADGVDQRAEAVAAATYDVVDRYILFELSVAEARSNG
jgi:hypothetical protein